MAGYYDTIAAASISSRGNSVHDFLTASKGLSDALKSTRLDELAAAKTAEEQRRYDEEVGFKKRSEQRATDKIAKDAEDAKKMARGFRAIINPESFANAEEVRAALVDAPFQDRILGAKSDYLTYNLNDPTSQAYKDKEAAEFARAKREADYKFGQDLYLENIRNGHELALLREKRAYDNAALNADADLNKRILQTIDLVPKELPTPAKVGTREQYMTGIKDANKTLSTAALDYEMIKDDPKATPKAKREALAKKNDAVMKVHAANNALVEFNRPVEKKYKSDKQYKDELLKTFVNSNIPLNDSTLRIIDNKVKDLVVDPEALNAASELNSYKTVAKSVKGADENIINSLTSTDAVREYIDSLRASGGKSGGLPTLEVGPKAEQTMHELGIDEWPITDQRKDFIEFAKKYKISDEEAAKLLNDLERTTWGVGRPSGNIVKDAKAYIENNYELRNVPSK